MTNKLVRFSIAISILAGSLVAGLFVTGEPESISVSPSLLTDAAFGTMQDEDEKLRAALERAQKKYDEKIKDFPARGELLNEWEKPELTLFITGRVHGYIEPCGCTGLETQKGGLLRRYACLDVIRNKGWNPVTIDAGNQIRRYGQQPLIKIQKIYQAICKTMNYDVVGFGVDDFKLPTIDLIQSMFSAKPGNENPFTCANVVIYGDNTMLNQVKIVERDGKRVGIICLLGEEHLEDLKNQTDLTANNAEATLQQLIPQLTQAGCDMTVLVAQSDLNTCRQIAKRFPVFDLLVTAGGAGDPTLLPEELPAENGHVTQMIQVGVKGMYAGVIGLTTEGGVKKIQYERIPLDYRFEPSIQEANPVKEIFKAYQDELKAIYWENNSDIQPRNHPLDVKFVGTEECINCHEDEYDIWAEGAELDGVGPHSRATLDLYEPGERSWVPRIYDPECLCCHVTGWNPNPETGMYPYVSGYLDHVKDKHLHGSGCENCHGPGADHVSAENNPNGLVATMQKWDSTRDNSLDQNEFGQMLQNTAEVGIDIADVYTEFDKDTDGRLNAGEFVAYRLGVLRKGVRLTLEEARNGFCIRCHDLDNSPDFVLPEGGGNGFDNYWPHIKHGDGE